MHIEEQITRLCEETCKSSMKLLNKGTSAVDVAELALQLLEDSPLTNAGVGSSLNWDGGVECDAAIMDGHLCRFACIGAVPNVKNPIRLARILLSKQFHSKLVPPIVLCGRGAWNFARENGLEYFDNWQPLSGPMVTDGAIRKFNYHKSLVSGQTNLESARHDHLHDTVGAIVLDSMGHQCVALSSGGVSLKLPGRIGDSSIPGSGFWVENGERQVSCCTTGIKSYDVLDDVY